jgi:hypothetical protein
MAYRVADWRWLGCLERYHYFQAGRFSIPTYDRALASLNTSLHDREAQIIVAVGTTIADRPPHESVRARVRTRLLPRMSSGEAHIRIGVLPETDADLGEGKIFGSSSWDFCCGLVSASTATPSRR